MMSEFTMQRNSLFHVHRNCTPENATFCTYRIMSTGWVDGEFNRISFEMFACEVAAELLEVETGTVVVLQARCGTLQAWSDVFSGGVRFVHSTYDRSCGPVAKSYVFTLSHGAWLTFYQPETGKNQHCDFTVAKHIASSLSCGLSISILRILLSPICTADAEETQLSSWVASAVCTEFTTSWRQSRRIWTNLPTAKSSCVVSAVWTHPSAVVTQFTKLFLVLLRYWGWWQVTT